MTTALIDADIVNYRCCASAENEDQEVALFRIDKLMQELLQQTGSATYISYLSGGDNFRYKVLPTYKANRKDVPRPKHYEAGKEHLITEWKSVLTYSVEADDALGIAQTDKTVICSIDKDLLQIPGSHWNWVKGVFVEQTWLEGQRWFWTQMLTGDRADNIGGFDGKMRQSVPEFISKALRFCETPEEMFETVYTMYIGADTSPHQFLQNAMCLHILQEEKQLWLDTIKHWTLPDPLRHALDQTYGSMKSLMDATSMEPTMMEPQTFGGPANGIFSEPTAIPIAP